MLHRRWDAHLFTHLLLQTCGALWVLAALVVVLFLLDGLFR
jgi:hypothetical protein